MQLHRNARTTPVTRRLIAHRVLRDQWSYTETAEAFGVSAPTVRKWVRRHQADEGSALEDRSSRPRRSPTITAPALVTAIQQLRTDHGVPAWLIGRALGVPRSTVRRVDSSSRPAAGRGAAAAAAPLRMAATGRHAASRYQAARAHRARGASHPRRSPSAGPWGRLGVRACRRRRPQSARVRRSLARSTRPHLRGVPAPGRGLVGASQGHRPACADGQRQRLSGARLSRCVRPARRSPSAHAALHAAHQRQGGALHSNAPPRMGLCHGTTIPAPGGRPSDPGCGTTTRERPHASLNYAAPWARLRCVA